MNWESITIFKQLILWELLDATSFISVLSFWNSSWLVLWILLSFFSKEACWAAIWFWICWSCCIRAWNSEDPLGSVSSVTVTVASAMLNWGAEPRLRSRLEEESDSEDFRKSSQFSLLLGGWLDSSGARLLSKLSFLRLNYCLIFPSERLRFRPRASADGSPPGFLQTTWGILWEGVGWGWSEESRDT